MKSFTVADLDVRGDLRAKQEYSYALLEQIPGALDMITEFSAALWRTPEEFEAPLDPGRPNLTVRWRASAPTAGMATIRCRGELASVSMVTTGINPDADRLTLEAFQRHLLKELRNTPIEPGFDLLSIPERPLVATVNFQSPGEPGDQLRVALADRCFGAAYFRYHGLA
jgi:hypothetical protein